jgi:hypothetical protein
MGKTDQAAGEAAPTTFVKYTAFPGIVAERSVTAKHLRDDLGLDYQGQDLIFNRANNYMIEATGIPDDVLDALKNDGDFTISTSEKPPRLVGQQAGDGTPQPQGSLPVGAASGSTSTATPPVPRTTAGSSGS